MFRPEDYVTHDVGLLLKEIGLNENCKYSYLENGLRCCPSEYEQNFNLSEKRCSCPTLYEAQKYLRQKHNISVEIYRNACGYCWSMSKADNGTFITDYDLKGPNDGGCWDDFEEALNDGIYNACKMIKKKKDESNKRNNNRR